MRRRRTLIWVVSGAAAAGLAAFPVAPPVNAEPVVATAVATTVGQRPVVTSTWASVSVGSEHVCAVATDGTMWCWGVLVAHGGKFLGGSQPVRLGTAADWVAVASGIDYSCGIRSGHTLWCWGDNSYGQLGHRLLDIFRPVGRAPGS